MVALPESARALLQSGQLAHLVTTNPDGSPQISIVWVGLDGDEIVLGGTVALSWMGPRGTGSPSGFSLRLSARVP